MTHHSSVFLTNLVSILDQCLDDPIKYKIQMRAKFDFRKEAPFQVIRNRQIRKRT